MNKILLFLVLLIASLSIVGAVQVGENVIFQTTDTGTNYHIVSGFNCTNITVYPTAFNINGENITTYSNINMSMESLTNTKYLNFTNNATITNLTVQNGFANFTLTSGEVYGLYYQLNDTKYDQTVAGTQVYFTSIPASSWYITEAVEEFIGEQIEFIFI